MILGHKIKLNPTESQAIYFRQAAGCARLAFNWGVARWIEVYAENKESNIKKSITVLELKKEFNAIKKEQFPFVYEVTKCACEGGFQDLANAFRNFFADCKKRKTNKSQKVRFPQFKKKHKSQPNFYLANDKLKFREHEVYISSLGWVNMAETLRFKGKVMAGRVSFQNNNWWLSVQVEVDELSTTTQTQEAIGIDLGLKILAVDSFGNETKAIKSLTKNLTKIKKKSRTLARKVKGSKRWQKTKATLNKAHFRVRNVRVDYSHKATTKIAENYAIIGVEDLDVAGMMKNSDYSRNIADASMSEFIRQLEYKTAKFGGQFVKVDRYFASSQICSNCGFKNELVKDLSIRKWQCPMCETHHERDTNAAKNIRGEAINIIKSSGSGYVGRKTLVESLALELGIKSDFNQTR
jgi:putative transposase